MVSSSLPSSDDRTRPLLQPLLVAGGRKRTVDSDIVDRGRRRAFGGLIIADELFEASHQRFDIRGGARSVRVLGEVAGNGLAMESAPGLLPGVVQRQEAIEEFGARRLGGRGSALLAHRRLHRRQATAVLEVPVGAAPSAGYVAPRPQEIRAIGPLAFPADVA